MRADSGQDDGMTFTLSDGSSVDEREVVVADPHFEVLSDGWGRLRRGYDADGVGVYVTLNPDDVASLTGRVLGRYGFSKD